MQHINFYTQPKKTTGIALSAKQQAIGIGAVFVVMLLIYAVLLVDKWGQEEKWQSLKHEQQALHETIAELQRKKKALENDDALLTDTQRLEENLQFYYKLLASIDPNAVQITRGFSEHLLGLGRQYVDGLWFTQIELTEGGSMLSLLGRAHKPEYIPLYLQKLSNEKVFYGQQFNVLRINTPEEEGPFIFEVRSKDVVERDDLL